VLHTACLHPAVVSAANLKSQMLLMPTLSGSILCTGYGRGIFVPQWWLIYCNAHHVCAAAPAHAQMHGCCVQVWDMSGLHLHHQYRPGCSFCCWLCTSGSSRWEDLHAPEYLHARSSLLMFPFYIVIFRLCMAPVGPGFV